MAAAANGRQQAFDALLLTQRTLGMLVELETGQRGFILSGRDEFLQPFITARVALDGMRPLLKRTLETSDFAGVRALRDTVDGLIAERIGQADAAVAQRRAQGYQPEREFAEHIKGKQLMDELRSQFDTLESYQLAVVDRRSLDSADTTTATMRLSGALAAGGTLLMVLALGLLHVERRLRDGADRALHTANERLEREVVERTEALTEAKTRIQSFAGELDLHVEEERRRLSREVHDQLGQIATAAKIVTADLVRSHPGLPRVAVRQLMDLLDEAIQTTRRIAGELRPPMLDDLGLGAAVAHHVQSVAALGKLETDIDIASDHCLPADRANQIFRILQEATTNVLRHAGATTLSVRGGIEGTRYRFVVDDDGRGPRDIRADASGVRNMRERAALVGGTLHFGPGPSGGTRVTVLVPLETSTP
jgi:signal transduction histidine kinase